jgi:hypothetical protein
MSNSYDDLLRQQQQQREDEARLAASLASTNSNPNPPMQIGSWPFHTYGAAQTQWTNQHK